MTDTKQRRTTPRKLAIIQLLAATNKEELERIYLDTGELFSFAAISMHLFHRYDHDLTKSQKRSLYVTLQGMVQEGLLVTRYSVVETSGNRLPQRIMHWHLPDKINDDMAFIRYMESTAQTRQAKAWLAFTG